MSQQINLLNPRLIPARDWLSLPLILVGVVLVITAEAALYAKAAYDRQALAKSEAELSANLTSLRQRVETVEKALAERKPNPQLAKDVAALKAELTPREETLQVLQNLTADSNGFSDYLAGFSRQALEGVWLTEFIISKSDLFIRGRLLDAAVLPVYVRRLNGEKAFRGRTFSTLDMKGVEPAPVVTLTGGAAQAPAAGAAAKVASAPAAATASAPAASDKTGDAAPPAPAVRLPYFVEFALHGSPPTVEKAGGKS